MLRTFTIEMRDSDTAWQTDYRPSKKDLEDLLNEYGPHCVRFKVLEPGDEMESPTAIFFNSDGSTRRNG